MKLSKRELKGGFHTDSLFYHSVSWITSELFGHARLTREVTDAYVQRKFEHAGIGFSTTPPELSDAEISAIPGAAAALGRLDSMKFEVLERNGASMQIKSDEHKYWSMQGGDIAATYAELRENHNQLANAASGQGQASEPAESEKALPKDRDGAETASTVVEMESLAKLEESIGVEVKVASEVSNVELILDKENAVWAMASQEKVVGKHVVIGGYGTGQWVQESDASPGLAMNIADGDKTIVQLDESTFNDQAQGVQTSSLFKLLLRAEQQKGVVEHKVSFLRVARKENLEAGSDSFDVSIKTPMKFKTMGNGDAVKCKNFFSKALTATEGTDKILQVFRYRWEKVGQSFKVQRPYVIMAKALTLSKDKPVKLSK